MSSNDVAKDFQHLYESSNNGEYFGSYFDGATYNRPIKAKDSLTTEGFMKAKKALEKANVTMTNVISTGWTNQYSLNEAISFAPLQAATPCQTAVCNMDNYLNSPKKPKGNNPMYVDNDKHIESSKINYLTDRVQTVYYVKAEELPKAFGLTDDAPPQSTQELVDRLTTGKFTFKEVSKKDTKGYFYRPLDGIRWRDPASKEDQAGYDAALVAFKKLYQDTKDTVAIGTPAEGLAAVKALDAWTPTVGTA